MICPACQHNFRLKLREYVSLRNRHRCPSCGRLLKLRLTASYLVVLFVWAALVAGIPYLLSRLAFSGFGIPLLVFFVCIVLLVLPVDYLMQSYWLRAMQIDHDKEA